MNDRASTHASIAVPVRDEEEGLPPLLDALDRQETDGSVSFSIHLFFDGCTDGGLEIAKRFFAGSSVPGNWQINSRSHEPNAGRARRAAANLAMSHLSTRQSDILLTTDADTIPDVDWVAQCAEALRKVDVVAGYTVRDGTTAIKARDDLESYLEQLHALRRRIDPIPYDPAPSHPWVGGANLGLRRSAFERLGGFRPLPSGEDKDLVDRARHLGLRVAHCRTARVTTSSRTSGRAVGGLADALQHMRLEHSEPRVEHPEDAARQYARHALARRMFAEPVEQVDWSELGRLLGTEEDLRSVAARVTSAEAFTMKAVPAHPTKRDLPLSEAARALAALSLADFRTSEYA